MFQKLFKAKASLCLVAGAAPRPPEISSPPPAPNSPRHAPRLPSSHPARSPSRNAPRGRDKGLWQICCDLLPPKPSLFTLKILHRELKHTSQLAAFLSASLLYLMLLSQHSCPHSPREAQQGQRRERHAGLATPRSCPPATSGLGQGVTPGPPGPRCCAYGSYETLLPRVTSSPGKKQTIKLIMSCFSGV